ncbi:MAG: EAL domain-containing protein [Legionellaceae bacterium]|nr:EAL domain-containing protein [Legionellaceae bacterium]
MNKHTNLFESIFIDNIQPMIVINQRGVVQKYNAAAEKLFQYTQAEMLGHNIKKIMPSNIAKQHDGYLKTYQKTHVSHIIGTPREVRAQKKDGSLVDILLCVTELDDGGEAVYVAVISDVSEARNLRNQNQKLIDFNLAIMHDVELIDNYNDLIQNILKHFSILFEFEVGHFYQYNHIQDQLESSNLFFKARPRKYHAFIEVTQNTVFKKGIGLPGTAWAENAPVYFSDIRTADNFPRQHLSKKPLNLAGGLALPVQYDDHLLGVVEFFSDKVLHLNDDDIVLMQQFSTIINRLYGQYRESRVLNLLLDSCIEGVYGLDMNGITTFVNARACAILGYTAEELIGCSMHEKVHYAYPDGRAYPKKACHISHCVRENKSLHIDDEVFWTKQGRPVDVEYNVTSIIENKNIVGGVVTFLDISEKRRIQQQMDFISSMQSQYIAAKKKSEVFKSMLSNIITITKSEYGFIGRVKYDATGLPYLKTYAITDISWDKSSKNFYDQYALDGLEFRSLDTLFGYTLKTGKVVISNDPLHDKRRGGLPKGHPALSSYLGMPLMGLDGELIGMYGIANREEGYSQQFVDELKPMTQAISNIIESYQYYITIENMAKTDALTKLSNRQFTHHTLSKMIEKHRRNKTSFSLLMVDLNQFKFINDKYGASIGDELLIAFSKRVSAMLKSSDFFARVGGDEFLILLEATTHSRHFTQVVSDLTKIGSKPYTLDKKSIHCPMTLGVACYPSGGNTKEDLLSHVAFALYDAKRKKEPICFFSKKSKQYFEQVIKLESEVKHAFIKKEFCMLYQPQVDLMTGDVVGVEALIRWNHPTRGLLSPDKFIPYIEDWDLSGQLNAYVIDKVLEDISLLTPKNCLKVSINVSPKVVDFRQHIAQLVSLTQAKYAELQARNIQLEFEITESSFSSHNARDLNMALLQAKKEGIQCAMDDFGTEYSSINRLTQYQFDTVKIDKVFTQRLDQRSKKSAIAIINALIQLSGDLKFTLIAEGPETKEQVSALLDIGCVYGQGYYFYKPMLIKKVRQILKRQAAL